MDTRGREGKERRGKERESELTGVCLSLHISLPLRPILLGMKSQMMRPGAFNDVLGPFALEHNLIRQAAALRHDESVQRIAEMPMVHHGVISRILTFERHLPAGLRSEQDRHHRESLLVVRRDFPVRFWTVALCVPELDVGLLGSETDGIASFDTWGFLPQFRVGKSIVQSGECEGAEWELGEETRVILLILCEGFFLGAFVPDKVVRCKIRLRDFVENQSELVEVSTSLGASAAGYMAFQAHSQLTGWSIKFFPTPSRSTWH